MKANRSLKRILLISNSYGFYDECIRKYGGTTVWAMCADVFDYLTISVLIEKKIFCIHGGLSPNLKYLDDIRNIPRFQDIPHDGVYCDLLWSDPEASVTGFKLNSRGAGWVFGGVPVKEFNYHNSIDFICRAHQLVMEGYEWLFNKGLVTVWSAPNYCYRCGNVASIMSVKEDLTQDFLVQINNKIDF